MDSSEAQIYLLKRESQGLEISIQEENILSSLLPFEFHSRIRNLLKLDHIKENEEEDNKTIRQSILESKLLWRNSKKIKAQRKSFIFQESQEISANDQESAKELLRKASILRNNTVNFSEILSKDVQNIRNTSEKLEAENISISKGLSSMKKLNSSSWTTTLLLWGSVLIVVLTFIGTFIFMRFFKKSE